MAQSYYTIDLKTASFPLLSEQQSRTVMKGRTSDDPNTSNYEKPSISYCHNVMPSQRGLYSVGFRPSIAKIEDLSASNRVDDVRTIFGDKGNRFNLTWDANGNPYVIGYGSYEWRKVLSTGFGSIPGFDPNLVTIATVNGLSYIFYSKLIALIYNETSNALVPVTLTGLEIPSILGIVTTQNYLIAYTKDAIAWSSLIVPTDFTPSAVTGAGGGNVPGIDGPIKFVLPHSGGIIIYTLNNAIAGTFTGNGTSPFKFRKIDDAKGGINIDQVAYESGSKFQFSYTRAGLQVVNTQSADTILPQVTDFLSGRRFEDFNEDSLDLVSYDIPVNETIAKKLKFISSRYLVISYGWQGFNYALIYDIILDRLGKVKIDHVDVFEFVSATSEPSKESIGFLKKDGSVDVMETSVTLDSSGVLLLGKIQASFSRITTLLSVEIENVQEPTTDYTLYDFTSLDGKNYNRKVQGYLSSSEPNLRVYYFKLAAKNHTIAMLGKFNLVTALLVYTLNGRR